MPSHCRDEHDHDHGHGGHDHDHSHTDDITPALQSYLYGQIEFDKINTLNESVLNSGAAVVKKGWDKRMETTPELVSDADEQLLMYLPFTGQVKLHSILLRSSADRTAPKTVKLFLNREDLDFDTASDTQPTQTLELSRTSEVQDVPLKRALWNTTRSITLFFPDNFNDGDADDVTRFSFLGFKGDWMPLSREPINVTYEAAANPSDHTPVPGTRTGFGTGLGHDAEGY